MTNKQAIAYIESLMGHYEASTIHDKHDPTYRYAGMWISNRDMIALKMGIEALKYQGIHAKWLGDQPDGYADGNPVYTIWRCSHCGSEFQCEDMDFHYCPSCGAYMDEGQGENT